MVDRAVAEHPCAQHRTQQLQHPPVTDTFLDRLHQSGMRNRLETVGDVRLNHPPASLEGLVVQPLECVVGGPLRAEPVRTLGHVRFEDRLDDDLRGGLHDPITDRRDRQWPAIRRAGLGYPNPPRRQRPPRPRLEVRREFIEQPVDTVPFDVLDGGLIDAGRATVGAHLLPRPLQHISAVDLVVQRVEPSPGIGLGRPVYRTLQLSDLVLLGGTSRLRHSPALPRT